jgi:hypothetical protein
MRFALLCAAALLAAPAMADELVASNGNDSVRLSDGPCTSQQVLDQLDPSLRPAMHDASAVVQGQTFKACWVVHGDAAHLLYEDGDQGLIPLSDFKIPQSAWVDASQRPALRWVSPLIAQLAQLPKHRLGIGLFGQLGKCFAQLLDHTGAVQAHEGVDPPLFGQRGHP